LRERIKQARKALGLSREKFAEGLGFKSAGKVQNVELGRTEIDDTFVRLISQVYHISYQWLTTGEGEMFRGPDTREQEISRFVGEALADEPADFRVQLLHVLSRLTDEQWNTLADVAELLLEEQGGHDPPG